ncbi:MAG: transposase [Anaerolineaceae bacterium]
MKFDPSIHHRKSIRLPGYDYSQEGAYFVTICSHGKIPLFGHVVGAGSKPAQIEMKLNQFGDIVLATWHDLPHHIPGIRLGEFVVMPNHVHWIIWITEAGAGLEPAPTGKRTLLPEIVRQFKTFSARRINLIRGTPGHPVWQRNYYEHIIRDDEEYSRIAEYILDNPLKWETDDLYCL